MTASRRRVVASAERRLRAEPSPAPPRATWWVSPDAVRQAIGAWAATGRAGRTHPGLETIRAAVAVACAIGELAAHAPDDPDAVPLQSRRPAQRADDGARFALTRPVAYDPRRLGEMAGVGARDVERALTVLCGAGVVSQPQGDHGPLTLGADYLTPAPTAAIAWAAVRDRLAAVGAPVAAPCAVLRAVGEQMHTGDDGSAGDGSSPRHPPVRISVRDLEAFTGFARSTVSDAVAALVRARLLDADTRAGHTGRFALRPAAFGLPDEAPDEAPDAVPDGALHGADAPPLARPSALRTVTSGGTAAAPIASRAVGALPDVVRPADGSAAGAPVLVGTFAGTPIYAPAGTPLVVECDADGRWSCRVGPFLRLGPVSA